MKRFTLVVFLSVIAGGILLAVPTDEQIEQAASILEVPFDDLKAFVQSYQSGNVSSDAIVISAENLCSEYLANELAANNRYKGKIVLLTGKLVEVKTDYSGRYYASLEGVRKNYIPYTIDVYFVDSALNRLANITVGRTVTIFAICTGEKGAFSFILKDGTFTN
jgi:hypothetical protein